LFYKSLIEKNSSILPTASLYHLFLFLSWLSGCGLSIYRCASTIHQEPKPNPKLQFFPKPAKTDCKEKFGSCNNTRKNTVHL